MFLGVLLYVDRHIATTCTLGDTQNVLFKECINKPLTTLQEIWCESVIRWKAGKWPKDPENCRVASRVTLR